MLTVAHESVFLPCPVAAPPRRNPQWGYWGQPSAYLYNEYSIETSPRQLRYLDIDRLDCFLRDATIPVLPVQFIVLGEAAVSAAMFPNLHGQYEFDSTIEGQAWNGLSMGYGARQLPTPDLWPRSLDFREFDLVSTVPTLSPYQNELNDDVALLWNASERVAVFVGISSLPQHLKEHLLSQWTDSKTLQREL